eukprot:TRINITY_DN54214_c0_g1_i1.p1 TRINITY_DN54214_c0_g1~~TRINITY_DN54214_c0_g1_i1.p1  ORF type:complete len:105 (-),score=23.52 TRINITY_DN54214_c0_g1_i1:190-504(-)
MPYSFATCCPSSVDTCRSETRSILLPANTISGGVAPSSTSRTRRMASTNSLIAASDSAFVTLYTRMNAVPSRMYPSRSGLYSSCPAVSRMSRNAVSPSTLHVFR